MCTYLISFHHNIILFSYNLFNLYVSYCYFIIFSCIHFMFEISFCCFSFHIYCTLGVTGQHIKKNINKKIIAFSTSHAISKTKIYNIKYIYEMCIKIICWFLGFFFYTSLTHWGLNKMANIFYGKDLDFNQISLTFVYRVYLTKRQHWSR